MKTGNTAKAPLRALILLLMLTFCLFATSKLPSGPAARAGLVLAAVAIALAKVRLVVLDFLGLRHSSSLLARALLLWAGAVLLVALARATAFSAVFAN
ncbi:cytochrome-c oxidase subunit 4 domain-containing protein (plasmid) [Rhizobium phaseoli]|uniref:Cytochrome C oxidase subunit IV family protein n=1 Tax=Rhizobium phaseoli TaxID=396 RepID=A0A192TJV4_9HYPH|nr:MULTISPECIES: cytochrome C oxidase subunit IV family protein [Rhizobium]ANL30491.1 cytochrome-c oxidase subunit 4 domain-containing protein [Rhizobium phaseoli]ANL42917.1 cytochrome-c oxidase subunit 4 domain-containing protein [Rhizobium phaseoli]ANL55597.1 cytochrome-c oxidase subunit 4 domain-containing protein [Rhizobium phaseoli]ANL61903.1 cytochrome-c oxidase subunit 4 domain-containing protein [Rhizobium phaseoli]ANL87318.1 cytochrome-c oxidase subunit 4 domain-containing protein [Rh